MKKESPLNSIKILINIINKYNMGIFITLVAAGLMFCILVLSNIVYGIYDSPGIENTTTVFDQTVISQLRTLDAAGQNPITLNNSERIDPFHE